MPAISHRGSRALERVLLEESADRRSDLHAAEPQWSISCTHPDPRRRMTTRGTRTELHGLPRPTPNRPIARGCVPVCELQCCVEVVGRVKVLIVEDDPAVARALLVHLGT